MHSSHQTYLLDNLKHLNRNNEYHVSILLAKYMQGESYVTEVKFSLWMQMPIKGEGQRQCIFCRLKLTPFKDGGTYTERKKKRIFTLVFICIKYILIV